MAASSNGELTGDGREDALNLAPQGEQDTDGDHGNEGENQGVLHESLALFALHPAQRGFGACDKFDDHCFSPPFRENLLKKFKWLCLTHAAIELTYYHSMCHQKTSPKN
jgi:hypothetical protein